VDLASIALPGLDRAEAAFGQVASNIARATTPDAAPVDPVDLSAAMVDLLAARTDFSILADQIERRALDILA
jgi:hypothetical protein